MRYYKPIILLVLIILVFAVSRIIHYKPEPPVPEREGADIYRFAQSVWQFENVLKPPRESLRIQFKPDNDDKNLFLALPCIIPAYINREYQLPILFDDCSLTRVLHEPIWLNKSISEFGKSVPEIAVNIAQAYWLNYELVIIAENYEQLLQAVPIASFIPAPLLIAPSPAVLTDLGARAAIVIGNTSFATSYELEHTLNLRTIEDCWEFQLALYGTKYVHCNYLVVANPKDIYPRDNIEWRYISLAAAPLAAYRNAIVLLGNYLVDRQKLYDLAWSTAYEPDLYNELLPTMEKLRMRILYAVNFALAKGHQIQYIAIVGGNYELPNYYVDLHLQVGKYRKHYVATLAPYANLSKEPFTYLELDDVAPYNATLVPHGVRYIYEDLAIGRIAGYSILDTTWTLMRTFFYQEFLHGGRYASIYPDSWESTAIIADGRSNNQISCAIEYRPLPPSAPYVWHPLRPDVPAFPVLELSQLLPKLGFNATMYSCKNLTNPQDLNLTPDEILDLSQASGVISYMIRGSENDYGMLRWDAGMLPYRKTGLEWRWFATNITTKRFPPAVLHVSCGNPGSLEGLGRHYGSRLRSLPHAFSHAGVIASVFPSERNTKCMWWWAHWGGTATIQLRFWAELYNLSQTSESRVAVGDALRFAKWKTYLEQKELWGVDESRDPYSNLLFGDPAFVPYHPKVSRLSE